MEKNYVSDLDATILEFRDKYGVTPFTLREACQGILVTGASGSGKTSSFSRMLALKYLKMGMGGLVMVAKNDEVDNWKEYARLTGRQDDLVILENNGPHHFNFIEFESQKKYGDKPITDNVVDVLKTVLEAGEMKSEGNKSNESFWSDSLDLLLYSAVDLVQLAYGKVTVKSLYDIVTTAPKRGVTISREPKEGTFAHAFDAANANVAKQIDAYKESLSHDDLQKLEASVNQDMILAKTITDVATFLTIDQFFNDYYKNLSEKTRSIVDVSFTGFLFRLLREPVYSLICKHTSNVFPEDCYLKAKIVVCNIPVKTFHKIGRDAQCIIKYCFQRAWEARDLAVNDRPLFLWQDEAQFFTTTHDADFQSTARGCKISGVLLTQNLPNLYASMGAQKCEYRVKALIGNLATRIYHANMDIETNEFASQSIGDAYVIDASVSQSISGEFSSGQSRSLKLERQVRPEKFISSLKTGGPENNFICEAYVQQLGKVFPNRSNYTKASFNQNYKP